MTLTVSYWLDLIGANLTRAKSGRITFLDVLSAVPHFFEGLLAVYSQSIRRSVGLQLIHLQMKF